MNYVLSKGKHEVETDSDRIVKRYLKRGYTVKKDVCSEVQPEVPEVQPNGGPHKLSNSPKRRRVSRKVRL